jgi:hypothetical protein
MSTSPTAVIENLLGLPSLQLVVEKEARQAAYTLHCYNLFKKSNWGHSAFSKWQRMISQFYWLLLTVCYLSREKSGGTSLSNGLKFYTDGSLFEGRAGSGVFSKDLNLKASFALKLSPLSFRQRFTLFWLVPIPTTV